MPTTPTQRGTSFKTEAAPTATAFLIDASTYKRSTEYQNRQTILDNNMEDATEVFQNAADMIECEATVKSGQTAPTQGALVTLTFPDASTVEYVVIDPVPLSGFGMVQRISLKLKKATVDYSP